MPKQRYHVALWSGRYNVWKRGRLYARALVGLLRLLLLGVVTRPTRSILTVLLSAEACFLVWFLRHHLPGLGTTPDRHEPEVHDGVCMWSRMLALIKIFHGRPEMKDKLRGYISKWFLDAPWEEIRRGNLEEVLCFLFFYKSRAEMERAGMGHIPSHMVDEMESVFDLHVPPGYNPGLGAMLHLWEPLKTEYRPLFFYGFTEGMALLSGLVMMCMGYTKRSHGGFVFYTRNLAPEHLRHMQQQQQQQQLGRSSQPPTIKIPSVTSPPLFSPTKHSARIRGWMPRATSSPHISPSAGGAAAASATVTAAPAAVGAAVVPVPTGIMRDTVPRVASTSMICAAAAAAARTHCHSAAGLVGAAAVLTAMSVMSGTHKMPANTTPDSSKEFNNARPEPSRLAWAHGASLNIGSASSSVVSAAHETQPTHRSLDMSPCSHAVGAVLDTATLLPLTSSISASGSPPPLLTCSTEMAPDHLDVKKECQAPVSSKKKLSFDAPSSSGQHPQSQGLGLSKHIGENEQQRCHQPADLPSTEHSCGHRAWEAASSIAHVNRGICGVRDSHPEAKPPVPPRAPVVFLHGVGLGLLTYLETLGYLALMAPKDQPLVVMELRHVAMRLTFRIPSADDVAGGVMSVLDHLGMSQACVVAHSYSTFVASRIVQLYRERVASLVLLDPVCLGMFMPSLLRNFMYSPARTDSVWHAVKDRFIRFISRDLHCAATFCRKFYWTEVNLYPDDLPSRSFVLLAGRDELLHGEEMSHLLEDEAKRRSNGREHKLGEGPFLHLRYYPDMEHADFLLDHKIVKKLIADILVMAAKGPAPPSLLKSPSTRRMMHLLPP